MKLQLVTLLGKKMDEDVYEVIIQTADGPISVFGGHMPLVTAAVPGVVSVRRRAADPDSRLEHFAINGGIVEITNQQIRILVDEADAADEIIEAESQKALERAQKLKAEAKNAVELEQAQALIDRHRVRLKVAELKHRHH